MQASAEDIVVTNGTQQAIDVVARVLLVPGDRVAVEDPGYVPPRLLFQSLGARVVGVPVDRQGLVVDQLPNTCRLVHVTPSHQYPLGMSMAPARRFALLEWARRHDAAIIEDDYDTEFRFGGRPLEPLQTLDSSGRVIYVGSTILARDFSDQLEVIPSAAGLHVTAIARRLSVEQLSEVVRRACAAGVEVQQLSAFAFSQPAQAGLVLGYGAISIEHIEDGLQRLRSCFR